MQGIIQFPSYHAAGAVLLSYAVAGFPRWIVVPTIIVETVLIVSAIPIGGHHLVDVLAGAALAIASIALARYISLFELASPTRVSNYSGDFGYDLKLDDWRGDPSTLSIHSQPPGVDQARNGGLLSSSNR